MVSSSSFVLNFLLLIKWEVSSGSLKLLTLVHYFSTWNSLQYLTFMKLLKEACNWLFNLLEIVAKSL